MAGMILTILFIFRYEFKIEKNASATETYLRCVAANFEATWQELKHNIRIVFTAVFF